MHRPNFTAQLTNLEAARTAAASIGCTQTRGAQAGRGSVREMLEGISAGEILVLHHVYEDADQMREAAARIRVLADGAEDAPALRGLANALEHAAKLHDGAPSAERE